jgi:hypothetical protein
MPWSYYGAMKEEDLKAIFAYLQTIPAVENKVQKFDTQTDQQAMTD